MKQNWSNPNLSRGPKRGPRLIELVAVGVKSQHVSDRDQCGTGIRTYNQYLLLTQYYTVCSSGYYYTWEPPNYLTLDKKRQIEWWCRVKWHYILHSHWLVSEHVVWPCTVIGRAGVNRSSVIYGSLRARNAASITSEHTNC